MNELKISIKANFEKTFNIKKVAKKVTKTFRNFFSTIILMIFLANNVENFHDFFQQKPIAESAIKI